MVFDRQYFMRSDGIIATAAGTATFVGLFVTLQSTRACTIKCAFRRQNREIPQSCPETSHSDIFLPYRLLCRFTFVFLRCRSLQLLCRIVIVPPFLPVPCIGQTRGISQPGSPSCTPFAQGKAEKTATQIDGDILK